MFLLFALAVALLSFCAWSSRKRKFHFQHPVGGRDYDADGYEMNHKKPVSLGKIADYGNHYTSIATSHTSPISGKHPGLGSVGDGRTESFHEDNKSTEDFSTTRVPGFPGISQKGKIVEFSSKASYVGDRLNNLNPNSNLAPDLHIPRLNENESYGRYSPCTCTENQIMKNSSKTTCAMASSTSFRSYNLGIDPRFCVAYDSGSGNNRTFYVETIPSNRDSSKTIQMREKCPDLLELSKNTENLANNNAFCTLPRKRSCKTRKNRGENGNSDSRSPLLSGNSNDGCNSNSDHSPNASRRQSLESGFKISSFPSIPGNLNQHYFPAALDESPKTLKYKSWKLEKFLKEYRSLQNQLYRMKESGEDANETGDASVSNSTGRSNLISINGSASILSDPFQSVNAEIVDDNIGSRKGIGGLLEEEEEEEEEHNNNLKANLKSKSFKKWADNSCWSPEGQSVKLLPESNGKQTFCQG